MKKKKSPWVGITDAAAIQKIKEINHLLGEIKTFINEAMEGGLTERIRDKEELIKVGVEAFFEVYED